MGDVSAAVCVNVSSERRGTTHSTTLSAHLVYGSMAYYTQRHTLHRHAKRRNYVLCAVGKNGGDVRLRVVVVAALFPLR